MNTEVSNEVATNMVVTAHLETETIIKADILRLWPEYQRHSAELSERLYELKTLLHSPGKKDAGFKAWLKQNSIPRSTAYWLIKEHMKRTGMLPAKKSTAPSLSNVGHGEQPVLEVDELSRKVAEKIGEIDGIVKTFALQYRERIAELESQPDWDDAKRQRVVEYRDVLERAFSAIVSVIADELKELRKAVRMAKKDSENAEAVWKPLLSILNDADSA